MTDQNIFAIAPLEMARDRRLGAPHLRVLLALLAHRSKNGNLEWPTHEWLYRVTGESEYTICKLLDDMEKMGLLEGYGSDAVFKPNANWEAA